MPLPLVLRTDAFEDGGIVPARYGCFGENLQPGFVFNNVPEVTVSLAMLLHDIDVALDQTPEDGVHWILWNIAPEDGGLPEGWVQPGVVVGRNVENRNAYLGPGAPPGPRYHHYVFELFALDRELELPSRSGRPELLHAMTGHVIDKATYVGRFRRENSFATRQ